jgi:hypothetical protein
VVQDPDDTLDLLFLFSYSGAYAYPALPQVLRGLLQEVRPRRVVRNERLPCQHHIRGVLVVRREAKVFALRSDPWPATFCGPEKELWEPVIERRFAGPQAGFRCRQTFSCQPCFVPRSEPSGGWHARPEPLIPYYFGRGASLMVLPSRADCRAASRICITTTLVSSEVRSPSGCRVPLSTAAR